MDSYKLTDLVIDRLGGEVPTIPMRGLAINLHAIVLAVLEELRVAGFIGIERPEEAHG